MSGKTGKSKKAPKDDDVQARINEIIIEGGGAGLSGGAAAKMEVDYSDATEKRIPDARKLADAGKLDEALELLLALEKQTRTGGDMHSTSKILVAIVQLCFEAKNWTMLNEQLISLTKKRSQLKAAVTKMVQECFSYVKDQKLPRDVELKLIATLRSITEGKIYVEVERARLTHRLCKMQEEDGDVQAAAKTMQELAVETYGSMDRKEKVELILEQMRLCLATKDYIRTQIISKKISTRYFENTEDADVQKLKLKFYEYMIELDQHEGTYLNICRHYRAIYDTPCVQTDPREKLMVMRHVALYIILSSYDNEQSDLIHRILKEKVLEDIPVFKALLTQFTTMELIDQAKLCELYEVELRKGSAENPATSVFDQTNEGKKRWGDLKSRVVEHNIRIMAKYYTRITLKRMAEMLELSVEETEEFLSAMVVGGTVEAKTDRLEGIVNFKKSQNPNEMMNEWSHNISELMDKVQEATHLINKEEMVHKHMLGLPVEKEAD